MNIEERIQRAILNQMDKSLSILQSELICFLPKDTINFQALHDIIRKRIEKKYLKTLKEETGDRLMLLGENEETSPIMLCNIIVWSEIKKLFQHIFNFIEKSLENEEKKLTLWAKFITENKEAMIDMDSLTIISGGNKLIKEAITSIQKIVILDKNSLEEIVHDAPENSFMYDLASAILDDESVKEFVIKILNTEDIKVLEDISDSEILKNHKWSKPLSAIIHLKKEAIKKGIKIDSTD